jgi:hypothetical protein
VYVQVSRFEVLLHVHQALIPTLIELVTDCIYRRCLGIHTMFKHRLHTGDA